MESDEILFELVATMDDKEAFETLVLKYRLMSMYYVAKLIGDSYYAQDIAQEVFAKIYFKRAKIFPVKSFKSYLYKTLKNESIDWIRKNRKITELDIDDFSVPNDDKESLDYLPIIKNKLSVNEYKLVILRIYYDLSFREIADTMGISTTNARVRFNRTKKKLKGIKDE